LIVCSIGLTENYSDLRLESNLNLSRSLAQTKSNVSTSHAIGDRGALLCGAVGNCQVQSGGICKPGLFYCDASPSCPQKSTKDLRVEENLQGVELFDVDKYYNIRNSFLDNSAKGREYIGKYYSISEHFKSSLDFELAVKIVSSISGINETIDKINDPNYNGTIITTDLKDDLIDAINNLSSKTQSSMFQSKLNLLILDLENLTNMNKNEFFQFFAN
jgi:hypothetical protein